MGYDVCSMVASGEEAVERVGRDKPDLVLMDIVLRDEMDGIEAARQIALRFNVPVVFLTSYADDEVLPRARAASPFGYIVEDVRSSLQVRAKEKRLALDVAHVFPLPRTIRTDPVRLRQILVNLVGNALKFTETGGVKITVRCVRQEDDTPHMQFEVADTGIGISDEDMSRVFQPFTQANDSNTRRFGGTGLGLSVSQKLAELLGGRIDVRSKPGKGSIFTLTFDPGPLENVPMLESPAATSIPRKAPFNWQRYRKLHGRILLVEDEESMQGLFSRFFVQTEIEMDLASDGRIAYEKASESKAAGRPYDLILLDIRMPEIDGYEVARRLRQDGWQGPIIAQTAYACKRHTCPWCVGREGGLLGEGCGSGMRERAARIRQLDAGRDLGSRPISEPFIGREDRELAYLRCFWRARR